MRIKINDMTWAFLKIDMRHWVILKSTSQYKDSDRGRGHFLKSTCDIGDPQSRAPNLTTWPLVGVGLPSSDDPHTSCCSPVTPLCWQRPLLRCMFR